MTLNYGQFNKKPFSTETYFGFRMYMLVNPRAVNLNTMNQIHSNIVIHAVLVVKDRAKNILPSFLQGLNRLIYGIIDEKGQTPIVVNGHHEHVHLLFRMKQDCKLSEVVRNIKTTTSRWVNENGLSPRKFRWEKGHMLISCNYFDIEPLVDYINNQGKIHTTKSFGEEYIQLQNNDIFNERISESKQNVSGF